MACRLSTLFILCIALTILTSSILAKKHKKNKKNKCKDIATNCVENSNLCRNRAYELIMSENCSKTCGTCKKGGNNSNCQDANSSCAQWDANGFCDSAFYADDVKEDNCAATCGFC
ncbi:ShTK domain protein [Aphelenchoides bicaudatus]|nr:ShTK domain protein [Aphelenchoides bicaudatus]